MITKANRFQMVNLEISYKDGKVTFFRLTIGTGLMIIVLLLMAAFIKGRPLIDHLLSPMRGLL